MVRRKIKQNEEVRDVGYRFDGWKNFRSENLIIYSVIRIAIFKITKTMRYTHAAVAMQSLSTWTKRCGCKFVRTVCISKI